MVGASFAGLFAAAAAAQAGFDVTVCERDDLADATVARRGVPPGGRGHVLLHRGLLAAGSLLPGLAVELRDADAVELEFDSGAMPFRGDGGWLPSGTGHGRVIGLATAGDAVCARSMNDGYHLTRPSSLVGPRVVAAVLRGWPTPVPATPPRPEVLTGQRAGGV